MFFLCVILGANVKCFQLGVKYCRETPVYRTDGRLVDVVFVQTGSETFNCVIKY